MSAPNVLPEDPAPDDATPDPEAESAAPVADAAEPADASDDAVAAPNDAPPANPEAPADPAASAPADDSAPAPLSTASPEVARRVLEALLFAADQPVPVRQLSQTLGRRLDARAVRAMVDDLNAFYTEHQRAFEIVEIAGGFQMLTRPEYSRWVGELHKHRRPEKLSPSAVETLAIVAYRQPALRVTIDDIRGVQTGPLLRSLMERGLIKVVGFQNVPGHPKLYGTTRLFLEHFGLKSLKDLPRKPELTPP